MLAKRLLGLLGALALLVMFSLSFRTPVQADELLQDLPRLDGMKVYFTEAGGEASRFDRSDAGLSRFAGLLSQLGADLFTLEWRTGFPTDADLIVIAGPTTDFAPDQIARLWSYMNNGGRVLLMANAVIGGRNAPFPAGGGLFGLMWADMGLRALDTIAVTEGTAPVYAAPEAEATDAADLAPEATPEIIGEQPVLISTFAATNFNSDSPIMAGLEDAITLYTPRVIEVDAAIQGFEVTPLLFTTNDFYGESAFAAYLQDGTFNFDIGVDTPQGVLPLAAAYSNERTSSRIVLIGDRELAINGMGMKTSPSNSAGFVHPGNARFLLNVATWLLEAEPLELEFPTPAPTATVTITPTITPTRTPTAAPTSAAEATPAVTTNP